MHKQEDYYAIRRTGQIFGITTNKELAYSIVKQQQEITPDIKIWMEVVSNLDTEHLYCNFLEE